MIVLCGYSWILRPFRWYSIKEGRRRRGLKRNDVIHPLIIIPVHWGSRPDSFSSSMESSLLLLEFSSFSWVFTFYCMVLRRETLDREIISSLVDITHCLFILISGTHSLLSSSFLFILGNFLIDNELTPEYSLICWPIEIAHLSKGRRECSIVQLDHEDPMKTPEVFAEESTIFGARSLSFPLFILYLFRPPFSFISLPLLFTLLSLLTYYSFFYSSIAYPARK